MKLIVFSRVSLLAAIALACLSPIVGANHEANYCPNAVNNPRAEMSGVVGKSKCNVCVAPSNFWFYNTVVKKCAEGGHNKGKYDPTLWTSPLKGDGQDHTLQDYLPPSSRALLYHGTSDANLKFMIGDSGRMDFEFASNHLNQLSRGIYLTASPNEAKTYACQPKADNLGRAAVMILDPGPAALSLKGREETGIGVRSISKTYTDKTAVMNRIRSFDTKAASFIRLKNKRNQFAFKGGSSITGQTPAIAPKLGKVTAVVKRVPTIYGSTTLHPLPSNPNPSHTLHANPCPTRALHTCAWSQNAFTHSIHSIHSTFTPHSLPSLPRSVAVVLLGRNFQRLTETDENRHKVPRPGQTYISRCNVKGLDDADTVPADYTWGKLGLDISCGMPKGEKIPLCTGGAFRSFKDALTLNTCR